MIIRGGKLVAASIHFSGCSLTGRNSRLNRSASPGQEVSTMGVIGRA